MSVEREFHKKPKLVDKIFKPTITVCAIIIVFCSVALYFLGDDNDDNKDEHWDSLAIATSMAALDQFAPEVDYDDSDPRGWFVIHREDDTTVVWAPQDCGRVAILLVDDEDGYAPYYISVNGDVKLDWSSVALHD